MKKLVFTLLQFLFIFNSEVYSQVSFDNYANIHTIGISLRTDIPDIQNDLSLSLEYKKATDITKSSSKNDWIQGFEMVQTNTFDTNLYNSSIFYCSPNTEYYIKVTLVDPTTPSLNGIFYDTITTQQLEPITTYSKTYYVSPLGTNALYLETAPGNFQQALNLVQAGERIVLLSGIYNFGEITFNKSGTLSAPITIEGISKGSVLIDGSDNNINWASDPTSEGYKTVIKNSNCNVVIADGIRLYPHNTLLELRKNKIAYNNDSCIEAGVDGFFRNKKFGDIYNVLRVKFRDNSDPRDKDVKVGRYNFFMKLFGSQNIRFSKLDIKYYGSSNEAAIVLKNSTNIIFDNCHFEFNDIGV
ncbi:MAG TPA: chondroitinase-B domain-containing protein [Chitinophagales bacterium]|nr:chondroitinase-B domain-containing protein [Chitinophagales bacterium]